MTRLSAFLKTGKASISMLEFYVESRFLLSESLKTQGSDLIFR